MLAPMTSKNPQPEQAEHGHPREAERIRCFAGRGEQGLELQVSEPQG